MCTGDHDGAGRALRVRDDPTVIGRQIYTVGTKAAKLSGIKTERLPARRGRVSLVLPGR